MSGAIIFLTFFIAALINGASSNDASCVDKKSSQEIHQITNMDK